VSTLLLSVGVFFVALAATVLGGWRRFMCGCHVSRAVVRRLGYRRAVTVRNGLPWVGVPFTLIGYGWPYVVLTAVVAVWALDDWLFPDDDDRKRKHEWAKVRLRMPKPIKLRTVERWVPA
jgi:hypothetical protein